MKWLTQRNKTLYFAAESFAIQCLLDTCARESICKFEFINKPINSKNDEKEKIHEIFANFLGWLHTSDLSLSRVSLIHSDSCNLKSNYGISSNVYVHL